MKYANKLPKGKPRIKMAFKYGPKMYRGYLVNIGGKYPDAVFYSEIPASYKKKGGFLAKYKYMVLGGFIRSHALKKLGIEVNAGGGIFKPRAFKGSLSNKSFTEIKKIQKKY